jgi:hypothetical protein
MVRSIPLRCRKAKPKVMVKPQDLLHHLHPPAAVLSFVEGARRPEIAADFE